MPIFHRASMVKLIHNWIPTYSTLCRQGRETSSLCPRCTLWVETPDHVNQCENKEAIQKRITLLNGFLQLMIKQQTPIDSVACFSYKLSKILNIPQNISFQVATALPDAHHAMLIKAIQHQNLIRWILLIRGFIMGNSIQKFIEYHHV
jgi:hypothetical protein